MKSFPISQSVPNQSLFIPHIFSEKHTPKSFKRTPRNIRDPTLRLYSKKTSFQEFEDLQNRTFLPPNPKNSLGIPPLKQSRVFSLAKCKKKKKKKPFLSIFPFWLLILEPHLIKLSLLDSLSLQHRNPLHQPWKSHPPHYLSCIHEANSLPSVSSLLHHQESIWIHGGLKGTQTKA